MNKSKRVALYARVSTDEQTTENQLRELRIVAKRHGWKVVAEYVDQGVSGAEERPALDDEGRQAETSPYTPAKNLVVARSAGLEPATS